MLLAYEVSLPLCSSAQCQCKVKLGSDGRILQPQQVSEDGTTQDRGGEERAADDGQGGGH